MKHLTISELLLLSEVEKRARTVSFDPIRTILLGDNQTGKSSLVKAIYYSLGAEPAKQHPRWQNAQVTTLLKFHVDDQSFMLLRDGNFFSMFTGEGRFLDSFSNISRELGPYLASIFDFKLVLAARDESAETPPPAFLFLPYYVDQDVSWQNAWSGFSRLQQYSTWKANVAEYHTGVRDNYFYELQAEFLQANRNLNSITQQVAGLRTVIKSLAEDERSSLFDLNPALFGDQIESLLRESEMLLTQENDFKEQLADLNSQRALHRSRLDIATRALGEISGDLNFLSSLDASDISCPTCGTHYDNDFAARFAIASDEDRVSSFIAHIRGEIGRLDTRISDLYSRYRLSQDQATKIQQILATKQGEVTFALVVESEGRKAADSLLRSQLITFEDQRNALAVDHESISEKLKAHKEKLASTQRSVLAAYVELFRRNLAELEVKPLSADVYASLAPQIRETGSMLPRTLLAYYFAILELSSTRTPATVCPIIIDSPNQQAQDDHSLRVMLEFIAKRQPSGTQLILAVEKTMDVNLGGKLIELSDKYRLLNETDYPSVRAEITKLLRASALS